MNVRQTILIADGRSDVVKLLAEDLTNAGFRVHREENSRF